MCLAGILPLSCFKKGTVLSHVRISGLLALEVPQGNVIKKLHLASGYNILK
jgi:hypothetical protein